MKLKLLLLSLLLPFSAFGANTNMWDNTLTKVSWQFPSGSGTGKFWISNPIGFGAWGLDGSSLTNLNASALAFGTVDYARLPTGTSTSIVSGAGITVTQPTPGTYSVASSGGGGGGDVFTSSNNTFIVSTTNTFNGLVSLSNVLFNAQFDASLATNLNASALASGTVPYPRLPTNTTTNITGSGGVVITNPSPGIFNVDGSGISGGGETNLIKNAFRSGATGGSAFTFTTITNLTSTSSNGTVIARAQFMTVATAQVVVFARIHGGGMTNIACFTQASAQSNPIAGHVVFAHYITNQTTYTFDVWSSGGSLQYTNHVNSGATYPAMDNHLGITLVEHP